MGNDCLLPRCIACTCCAGGPSQRAPPRPGAAASGTGGGCGPPRPLLLPQPGAAGARGAPGLDLPPSREGEGLLQNSGSRVRASTGVCRSHTGARCPCWPGKDPCPQPRVPDGGPGPQAAVGLEQSAEGHEAPHASGGSVGGGDKGQEAGGCGASPQPRLQPLGTGRLLPADTASHCQAPPWERLHFQGGGRGVVTARGGQQALLPVWHGNLSQGAGVGPAARPPPRHTPLANKPKAALPVALNLAWELITCPSREGKAPTGGPAAPPGVCRAPIRPHACTAAAGCGSLPGTKASTQPGRGPRRMQGSRDAQICSIP